MSISRRSFVVSASTTLAVLAGSPRLVLPWRRRYALVIRGGTVFDGLGGPGIEADVAIDGGRVVAIARDLKDDGAMEIDARGMAVTPGFIDIHSHGDGTLWDDPRAESVVRQGVTTIVVGQDGSSRAPTGGATADGESEKDRHAFASFDQFWQSLKALQPGVNVASMVGLGTVRGIVIGNVNRPATPDERARMTELVEQALAAGACGASSGLEYTPGAFATREELIALCRPLSARRLPYATHMRNEDDHLLEAIDESIAVASGANCPLQISHLKTQGPRNWGKLDDVFARIHRARGGLDIASTKRGETRKAPPSAAKRGKAAPGRGRRAESQTTSTAAAAAAPGIDVAFDRYPYIAYQTGLSNLFPVWSRAGTTEEFRRRLGPRRSDAQGSPPPARARHLPTCVRQICARAEGADAGERHPQNERLPRVAYRSHRSRPSRSGDGRRRRRLRSGDDRGQGNIRGSVSLSGGHQSRHRERRRRASRPP